MTQVSDQEPPDFLKPETDESVETRLQAFQQRAIYGVRFSAEDLEQYSRDLIEQGREDERRHKRKNGNDVEIRTGPELLAALKLALAVKAVSAAEARPLLRKLIGMRGKGPKRGKQPEQLRKK